MVYLLQTADNYSASDTQPDINTKIFLEKYAALLPTVLHIEQHSFHKRNEI